MKRILILIMCVLILTGCAGSAPTPTTAGTTEVLIPETTVPETTIPETTAPVETTVPETEPAVTEPPLEIELGDHLRRFDSSFYGNYINYYLFLPENPTENMPLMVYLHGDSEVNKTEELLDLGILKQIDAIYGNDFPFILLVPCTREFSWTKDWIAYMTKALIDEIATQCVSDPEHIILTGHSRGAIGTWFLADRYGDFFSAAVPASHYSAYPMGYGRCAEVPVWAFVGDADVYDSECIPKIQADAEAVIADGGTVTVTVLEGRVHLDTETDSYTKETFDWMLAQ